jgi:hypothetical protein
VENSGQYDLLFEYLSRILIRPGKEASAPHILPAILIGISTLPKVGYFYFALTLSLLLLDLFAFPILKLAAKKQCPINQPIWEELCLKAM